MRHRSSRSSPRNNSHIDQFEFLVNQGSTISEKNPPSGRELSGTIPVVHAARVRPYYYHLVNPLKIHASKLSESSITEGEAPAVLRTLGPHASLSVANSCHCFHPGALGYSGVKQC